MRRTIAYHMWKAAWWEEKGLLQTHGDPIIQSGLSGSACRQAAIYRCIAEQCALYWLPHLKSKGIMPLWAVDYESSLSCHAANQVDEEFKDEILDIEGNRDNTEFEGDIDECPNFDNKQ